MERMDVVVDDVTQIWGEESTQVMALDRFSHHFRSGRFSCLLGPSGYGKSTLIQIVGGLEPATKGRVRIQNSETPDRQRPLGADSVIVWQNLNLFPLAHVIDNVATDEEMATSSPKSSRGCIAGRLISSKQRTALKTNIALFATSRSSKISSFILVPRDDLRHRGLTALLSLYI
jgi:NitT/TauT family transport system ATP-binding protein